jgi:hypothetical protein
MCICSPELPHHTYYNFSGWMPATDCGHDDVGSMDILFHRLLCDRLTRFSMIRFDVVHLGDSL